MVQILRQSGDGSRPRQDSLSRRGFYTEMSEAEWGESRLAASFTPKPEAMAASRRRTLFADCPGMILPRLRLGEINAIAFAIAFGFGENEGGGEKVGILVTEIARAAT